MNIDNFALLLAGPPSSAGGASGGSSVVSLVTFGLLFLVMYMVLIRPQSRRKKQHRQQLEKLAPGDKIATIGGIHGTVSHVDQAYIIVKVDDNTKIKFSKEAIGTVFPKSGATAPQEREQEVAKSEPADDSKELPAQSPKKKTSTTTAKARKRTKSASSK